MPFNEVLTCKGSWLSFKQLVEAILLTHKKFKDRLFTIAISDI